MLYKMHCVYAHCFSFCRARALLSAVICMVLTVRLSTRLSVTLWYNNLKNKPSKITNLWFSSKRSPRIFNLFSAMQRRCINLMVSPHRNIFCSVTLVLAFCMVLQPAKAVIRMTPSSSLSVTNSFH